MHRQISAVLLCMLFMSVVCAAPDASPQYGLSISAGLPLDEALQELARQTGMQIAFFSNITAGRRAPALSGKYTLAAALTRLLKGSDLTFNQVNEHTVEVRRAPPRSARLAPKPKEPQPTPAADDQVQEVTVTATAEQLVATRVPTPLREIPQTISVISSEQIQDEDLVDLGSVMINTPGIGVRQVNSLNVDGYSRGFELTSYHVNGGSALTPTINQLNFEVNGNPDMSEFDHVEVLRGSDALFSGNSDPGGTVSLVRKRPLSTPSIEATQTLGSWNNYRTELDATGPLTDDRALRARADLVYESRDYFYDLAHLNRKRAFAVLDYDFTPAATLTVGGSYQWDDELPLFSSIPPYSDGTDAHLPRSTSLTFTWAFYNTRTTEAYVEYRQKFAGDWTLTLNSSAVQTIVDYGYGQFGGDINLISHSVGIPFAQFSTRPDHNTLGTTVATLTGSLDWFGLQERITVGADFMRARERQAQEFYLGFGPFLTNVLGYDPAMYPNPSLTTPPSFKSDLLGVLEQYGGFAALRVDLTHGWSVSSGARLAGDTNRIDSTVEGLGLSGVVSFDVSSSHVLQPYNALMYRIDDHFSWYASEADVYLEQEFPYLQADGTRLEPEHGVTFESGLKSAWRDGALNGYLALYRVNQRNVPVATDTTSTNPFCCVTGATGRSQGVELGVDGELARGWLIGSGYTYNLYYTGTPQYSTTGTPRHLLKIWTSATLPGALARWTIGGTLRAQTTTPGAEFENCNVQGPTCTTTGLATMWPYAVLDLRAAYQISRNWQVALSVNNVFDKRYYLSQDTPTLELWYGDPRNVMLRIDARF